MAKCFSMCLPKLCIGGISVGLVYDFGVLKSEFILNSYGWYFSLCVFVGWRGVGCFYVGIVGSWLFFKALSIEVDACIKVI